MKREKIIKALEKFYTKHTINSILQGRRRPSYETMYKLKEISRIPFEAWADIKGYIK